MIETAEYRKLIKSGNPSDSECLEAWDALVAENDRVAGGYKYLNYLTIVKEYGRLFSQYVGIKATLSALQLRVDDEDIFWLKSQGFVIDTSSTIKYEESIYKADRRARNLLSKMSSKLNELEAGREKSNALPSSFDYVMANLSESLGREINDEITLVRYNEYCKIAKARSDARKKSQRPLQYG